MSTVATAVLLEGMTFAAFCNATASLPSSPTAPVTCTRCKPALSSASSHVVDSLRSVKHTAHICRRVCVTWWTARDMKLTS